jgi:hypothetical protein
VLVGRVDPVDQGYALYQRSEASPRGGRLDRSCHHRQRGREPEQRHTRQQPPTRDPPGVCRWRGGREAQTEEQTETAEWGPEREHDQRYEQPRRERSDRLVDVQPADGIARVRARLSRRCGQGDEAGAHHGTGQREDQKCEQERRTERD